MDSNNRIEQLWAKIKKKLQPLIIILGVVLLLVILLELSSFLTLAIYLGANSGAQDQRLDLNVFQTAWAEQYFKEFQEASVFEYASYLGFVRKPNYNGQYVNLNEHSFRKTVPSCPSAENKYWSIFTLGGSTMWGSGARDQGTIASLLAAELCRQNIPAVVTNLGESGYVSTQELIRLQLELKKNNHPHIVIFYDGFNDVYSTFQNKEAGLPQNVAKRETEFNIHQRFNPWGLTPHFNDIVERILRKLLKENYPPLDDTLAQETVESYIKNQEIAESLGEQFQFKPFFYWQPAIFSKNELSDSEQKIALGEYMPQSYLKVTKELFDREKTLLSQKTIDKTDFINKAIDLTDIFDNHPETIYIDWSHISEEGNAIIAKRIAEDVIKYVRENEKLINDEDEKAMLKLFYENKIGKN